MEFKHNLLSANVYFWILGLEILCMVLREAVFMSGCVGIARQLLPFQLLFLFHSFHFYSFLLNSLKMKNKWDKTIIGKHSGV